MEGPNALMGNTRNKLTREHTYSPSVGFQEKQEPHSSSNTRSWISKCALFLFLLVLETSSIVYEAETNNEDVGLVSISDGHDGKANTHRRRLSSLFDESENGMMISISSSRQGSTGELPFDTSNPEALSKLTSPLIKSGPLASEMIPLTGTVSSQVGGTTNKLPRISDGEEATVLNDANTKPQLVKATFKALRIQGNGDLSWIPVISGDKTFIIIVDNEGRTPAHIILPEGQQVVMLSNEADKSLELDTSVSVVVSYSDGSHIMISQYVLTTLKQLPVYAWQQQMPGVVYHSHGLVNIGDKISGNAIKDTRIQIAESLLYRNLFAAVRSENQQFSADYLTSKYGYLVYRFENPIMTGEFDTYRVCLYCLKQLSNHTAEVAAIFGGAGNAQKLTVGGASSADIATQLHKYFRKHFNSVLNHLFISEVYQAATSLFIQTNTPAGYLEITKQEAKEIYDAKSKGSSRLEWYRQVTLEEIASGKIQENCFVEYQTIGCFNKNAAEEFVKSGVEKADPVLQGKVSSVDGDEFYYKNGLQLSTNQIVSLLKELPDPFRVVLLSWDKISSRAWPSLMIRGDGGVINQFFVNVELLKSYFDVPVGYFRYTLATKQDLQPISESLKQRESWLKPKPTLLASGKAELSPLVFNVSGSNFTMNEDMAHKLQQSMSNNFNKMSPGWNPKPKSSQRVVVIKGTPYLFESDRFLETLNTNSFASTEQMDSVYQTIGLETENMYVIQVNETTRLQGRCMGKYTDKTSCDGNFLGQVAEKTAEGNWKIVKPFDGCMGLTSPSGCQGSYTDRSLKVKNVSVAVQSNKVSTYNFETIKGFSTIQGTSGSVKIEGNCTDTLDLHPQVCTKGTLDVHDPTKTPNEHYRMICEGRLQFSDLSCTSGSASFKCIGSWDYSKGLVCNGTMLALNCPSGGTVDACFDQNDQNNKMQRCDSLWNGEGCDYNWVYVPSSSNSYSYGSCRGQLVANTKCAGLFRGNYTKCSHPVQSGETCPSSSPPLYYQCDGLTDIKGCTGSMVTKFSLAYQDYKTTVESKKVPLLVSTGQDGRFNGGVIYNQSILTADQGTMNYKITCRDQLEIEAGTCRGMEYVLIDKQPKPITTRISCKQVTQLSDLSCKSGPYFISECKGIDRPSVSILCNGTFRGIACSDGGGADFSCTHPDKQTQDVICTGVWDGTNCIGEHSSQLIKIPNDLYIHGFCDGNFKINVSCSGRFYDAKYYNCTKDPYTVSDFKSVCFVKGAFGECQGLLDSKGCRGSYSEILTLNGKKMEMKSRSDSFYDFDKIIGNTTFKLAQIQQNDKSKHQPSSNLKIRCRQEANHHKGTCLNSEYLYSVEQTDLERPETTMSVFMKCPQELTLEGLECKANMTVNTCTGSSSDSEPSDKMTCIGTFSQKFCAVGGRQLNCAFDSFTNRYVECKSQTWNGTNCVDSQSGPWNTFKRKDGPTLKDSEGNELKSAIYSANEFTLNNPTISRLVLENSTLRNLHVQSGKESKNNTFTELHSPPSYNQITVDTADLAQLSFLNLQLDDVGFSDINKDQSVKIIMLQFNTLIVNDAVVLEGELTNSTIKSLEVGEAVRHDAKVTTFALANGKVSFKLKNVSITFPTSSSDWTQDELKKDERSKSTRLPFYEVGLYMTDFLFKIKPGGNMSQKNFMEFPEYRLEKLKLSDMVAKQFSLKSRTISAELPSVGAQPTEATKPAGTPAPKN